MFVGGVLGHEQVFDPNDPDYCCMIYVVHTTAAEAIFNESGRIA